MSEAEVEGDNAAVSATIVETDEAATGSAAQTQTALNEDVRNQTQVDICSDQQAEPSSAADREGQDRFSPHEQEQAKLADDAGNATATGELLHQITLHVTAVINT